MAELKEQSFRKHASLDPIYHFGVAPAIILNLIGAIVLVLMSLHTHLLTGIWILLLSAVLLLLVVRLRTYPLKVQDRIIRLEERLRMDALLPEALRRRIPELTEDQLIGLRFASDEELPSLVEMALEKKLSRRQIKERIQNWRPDHWRI
ncbi:MAG TPA: DUF6526 family protein [Acidobacteriaceae bacterium]|jgi:hypothetical protein|nr:DUF6526 family protein [Acidobacteriaceae bacterium]